MLQERVDRDGGGKKSFQVSLARHQDEVREAQRLRWQVFAEEMGARLDSPEPGLDIDLYDAHCEHLLVRDPETAEVVGTYRILSPSAAKRVGDYYTETEFDLTRLQHLRGNMVELGRSCVHADYRTGGVITLLWAGFARNSERAGAAAVDQGLSASGFLYLWRAGLGSRFQYRRPAHSAAAEEYPPGLCPSPLQAELKPVSGLFWP
jgi:putative hemolysin